MKKNFVNEKETSELKNSTELHIIDLDKLEEDSAIDYDKFSKEENLRMEPTTTPSSIHEKPSSGIMTGILKINWHLVLLVVFIFSVIFIIYRFKNWGTKVDLDNLGIVDDTNYDVETVDNILPLIYEGDAPAVNDGIRKVVLLGNDTFAQNKGTSDDMANMIAELSGATVYNCAFTGSYLTSTNNYIDTKTDPMDAFNLYWLTTAFTINNLEPYEAVFEQCADQIPADAKETFDTLCSIDFNTVDVIGIMYDANDYLAAKPLVNHDKTDDINCFTGNLVASINLIQDTYPHIRIIVMSPTYAYAINPDGDYVSSDIYCYLEDYKLSLYALMIERTTSMQGVSFVDNIYGTINENNADQYLLDHISLNVEGRKKLAERFVYALEYYDEKEE